jgi:hypothetical protein
MPASNGKPPPVDLTRKDLQPLREMLREKLRLEALLKEAEKHQEINSHTK